MRAVDLHSPAPSCGTEIRTIPALLAALRDPPAFGGTGRTPRTAAPTPEFCWGAMVPHALRLAGDRSRPVRRDCGTCKMSPRPAGQEWFRAGLAAAPVCRGRHPLEILNNMLETRFGVSGSILDDVKLLLMKKAGDPKILERIKRAAENNEVISIYEREYVGNLAKKHLDPMRDSMRDGTGSDPPAAEKPGGRRPPSDRDAYGSKTKDAPKPTAKLPGLNLKIIVPAVLVAGIVIGSVALMGLDLDSTSGGADTPELPETPDTPSVPETPDTPELPETPDTPSVPETPDTPELPETPVIEHSITTDQLSYEVGDVITITGTADPASGDVAVFLANPDGETSWSSQSPVAGDGSFSFLLLAVGPDWEKYGEYELTLRQGGDEARYTFFLVP